MGTATSGLLKKFFGIKKNSTIPLVEKIETYRYIDLIRLRGDIDMSTLPGVNQMIVQARKHRGLMQRNVILDFKNVKHVDSSTIAALIVMLNDLQHQRHRLALVNIPSNLDGMLNILDCRDLFSIYKTAELAFKALNRPGV